MTDNTQSPLERAARALAIELSEGERSPNQWFIEGGLYSGEMLKEIARCVLIAIREPSDAMIDAAGKAIAKSGIVETTLDLDALTGVDVYQAMIDAALEG